MVRSLKSILLSILAITILHGTLRTGTIAQVNGSVVSLAYSDDGKYLAVGYAQGVKIVNLMANTIIAEFPSSPNTNTYNQVAWKPHSTILGLTTAFGDITIIDINPVGYRLVALLGSSDTDETETLDWSPDGTRLATASRHDSGAAARGFVDVWNVASQQVVTRLDGSNQLWHNDIISSISWSPDSQFILTGGYDHQAIVSNVTTGQSIKSFPNAITSAWSPDGRLIATVDAASNSAGRRIDIWGAQLGTHLKQFDNLPGEP